jgi:hypothetical protein
MNPSDPQFLGKTTPPSGLPVSPAARRAAACIAPIDFSEEVLQVAGEMNAVVGRVVTIAYRGDTTDPGFRQEVYADFTSKAGVPHICVPAAGITKDALTSGLKSFRRLN